MSFFKKPDEKLQAAAIEELRQMVVSAQMPPNIQQIASKELELLSKISSTTSEYTIGLTYIDYLVSLPWNKKTEDNLDLSHAEQILHDDHYGLDKTKERLLEHLAVNVLRSSRKPHILVVDDEEIARKNLAHVLGNDNYFVVTAPNGRE